MLFSEPKIPQYIESSRKKRRIGRFSALQRAENSSIALAVATDVMNASFSALQRAENSSIVLTGMQFCGIMKRFSALQRAENSSILENRAL